MKQLIFLIVAVVLAIAATVLAFIFVVPGKAPGEAERLRQIPARLMHLQVPRVVEKILQALYIFSTAFIVLYGVLQLFNVQRDYWTGASRWMGGTGLLCIIVGPIAIRLSYELMMMAILLVKNVISINRKLADETGSAGGDVFAAPDVEELKKAIQRKEPQPQPPVQPQPPYQPQPQPQPPVQPQPVWEEPARARPVLPGARQQTGKRRLPPVREARAGAVSVSIVKKRPSGVCRTAFLAADRSVVVVGTGTAVLQCRLLALEHAESALRQRQQLVLAGVDGDGGDPADHLGDGIHSLLAIGDAAGEDDLIHLAVHNGGHGADLLADLIVERVHHTGDLLIVFGLRQQIAHVVGAGIGHQTAAAGEHAVHLPLGVLAGEALLHQLAGGQGAGALGREGTLAVQCVLGVHHAALHVGTDGNAAAHVADDEVQLLIFLALLLGKALGHGLLVQGVENADTLEQGMTGIARHISHLIDDHGVHDVGGDAQLVADLAGDQAAQVGGVLTLNADGAVRDHDCR